jgi:hypothetical protein
MITLQLSPNRWSCFVTSWAMIFNINVFWLMKYLGHDGGERWWPELQEPMCRRGFHIQDFMPYAWERGEVISEIRSQPKAVPYIGAKVHDYPINAEWLKSILKVKRGVIGVANNAGVSHACALEDGMIYDPSGSICSIDNFDHPIHAFWMISKVI